MPIELTECNDGCLLEVRLTGKLVKRDYETLSPTVAHLIKRHAKIRMLVDVQELQGWTAGALWEDLKFDAKHFTDIERLAIVGESTWEEGLTAFCKPFTTAEIRHFALADVAEARSWLAGA
jgi:hypothetical protein